MINILTKTTELAMAVTKMYLAEGDLAIDATCGNGRDTLALAQTVGREGKVVAVDIQERALAETKRVLEQKGIDHVEYVNANYRDLMDIKNQFFPDRQPSAIVFNLGYLPGGDKEITTVREDTLAALICSMKMIKIGGVITMIMYSGHEEGLREKAGILEMVKDLSPDRFHVIYGNMINQKKAPPEILWITRKKA